MHRPDRLTRQEIFKFWKALSQWRDSRSLHEGEELQSNKNQVDHSDSARYCGSPNHKYQESTCALSGVLREDSQRRLPVFGSTGRRIQQFLSCTWGLLYQLKRCGQGWAEFITWRVLWEAEHASDETRLKFSKIWRLPDTLGLRQKEEVVRRWASRGIFVAISIGWR